MNEMIGKRFDDYEIVGKIGKGGMGAVYKAHQISLHRDVAIKILASNLTEDEEFVSRFEIEARSVAQLNHPNIIQVYGKGMTDDGYHYLAMEFVDGEDLSCKLKRGDRFSEEKAIDIIIQACRGLEMAWKKNIIHRDIKPGNIIITKEGEIKIADFGLAKCLDASIELTKTGIFMGSVNYSSPEQGLGKRLDHRTDIYSLGIVLFKLLTDKLPFSAETMSGVIFQHVYEQPLLPKTINPGISSSIEAVVLKSIAKKPEDRYQDMVEFRKALEAVKLDLEMAEENEQSETELSQTVPIEELGSERFEGMAEKKALERKHTEKMKFWQVEKAALAHKETLAEKEDFAEIEALERKHRHTEKETRAEEKRQGPVPKDGSENGGHSAPHESIWTRKTIAITVIPLLIMFIGGAAWYLLIGPKDNVNAIIPVGNEKEMLKGAIIEILNADKVEEENPQEYTDPLTGMEFVFVEGGCYDMGDTFGDGDDDEKPVHEVCVDDCYMGKYEVTQGQWEKITGGNPSNFKNGNNCPVELIDWNDVQDFVRKLNKKTGKNYRLPTEAEWEYSARSGGKRQKYAGTSNESELGRYAWYGGNWADGHSPVGQKSPNGVGLYDMSGNVWEWCSDWYDGNYYSNSPKNNSKGGSGGPSRVFRGGSWDDDPRDVRASGRNRDTPDGRYFDLGFRLSRTP